MTRTTRKSAALPTWQDEEYYDVKLKRPVEYPPGSGRKIPVSARLTMKGKAAKLLNEADIADASAKSS